MFSCMLDSFISLLLCLCFYHWKDLIYLESLLEPVWKWSWLSFCITLRVWLCFSRPKKQKYTPVLFLSFAVLVSTITSSSSVSSPKWLSILAPPPGDAKPEEDEEVCIIAASVAQTNWLFWTFSLFLSAWMMLPGHRCVAEWWMDGLSICRRELRQWLVQSINF